MRCLLPTRDDFQKQEDVSKKIADLDKEIYRLNSQREKLEEAGNYQTNYMWEEYELTLHAAMELRDEAFSDLADLKKQICRHKDDIRNWAMSMSMPLKITKKSQSVTVS